jgi:hypothetical protein
MFSCKKPACLKQVIIHALTFSNVDQAKLRHLDPAIETRHCERCEETASYQVVPIKFGGME